MKIRSRLSPIPAFLSPSLALLLLAAPVAGRSGDASMRQLYAPFQKLLDAHLVERSLPGGGLVSAFRYDAAIAASETPSILAEQKQRLAAFDPATLRTRETAIAFWTNAYNYFIIQYLIENPKGGSVVPGVKGHGNLLNPYRLFGLEEFDVGGRRYSLDGIEKGILLGEEYAAKGWKDARVHFAVNCASVGCPPLRAKVYLPGTVDAMLAENTRRALLTPRHLRVEGETLHLTQLFEWYEGDYAAEKGSVRGFIAAHAGPELRRRVEAALETKFIKYDWALNSPENFPELKGDL